MILVHRGPAVRPGIRDVLVIPADRDDAGVGGARIDGGRSEAHY